VIGLYVIYKEHLSMLEEQCSMQRGEIVVIIIDQGLLIKDKGGFEIRGGCWFR
jgi:hypothetical protein